MDKVYIVTCGDYSEYHISRVFRDKHTAERYAAYARGSVEEFEFSDGEISAEILNAKPYWKISARCLDWASQKRLIHPPVRGLETTVSKTKLETLIDGPKPANAGEYRVFSQNHVLDIFFYTDEEPNFGDGRLAEKYKKIAKDAFSHIQSLIQTEGWTPEMANDWLKNKYGSEQAD